MSREFMTLLDAAPVLAITSSTNATPIVITKNSHGLATNDVITVNGHETNTAANGRWVVTKVNDNTFSLNGSVGNGIGGATGCFAPAARVAMIQDYDTAVISVDTASSASMTVKLVGSIATNHPDFAQAQSAANQYDFIDMVDLEDGASVDGDTGFTCAGTDDHRMFEANTNGLRWISVLPTAGTVGVVTVKIRYFNQRIVL